MTWKSFFSSKVVCAEVIMITGKCVNVVGHNENYSGLPVIVFLQLSFFY